MKYTFNILTGLCLIAFTSCGQTTLQQGTTDDGKKVILYSDGTWKYSYGSSITDNEITSVIYENLRAMENKDIAAYMATVHEQSEAYSTTEQLIKQLFNSYNLKYELSYIKVIEKSEYEAKVELTQITKKISGPQFRNNKVTMINTLKKSNGKWKVFHSDIKGVDYLD